MHVLDIFHRIRLYRHTTKQYYCTLKHMLPHCAPLCAPLTGKICKPLTLHSRHAGYGSATPTVLTCAMTPGGLHNAHAGSTHACMLREPLLPLLHCHCLPPHSAGVLQACARTPGRYRCCGCCDGRASLGWYVNAGQIPLPQCPCRQPAVYARGEHSLWCSPAAGVPAWGLYTMPAMHVPLLEPVTHDV